MSTESTAATPSPGPAWPVPRELRPLPASAVAEPVAEPVVQPFTALLADVEPLGRQALLLIYAEGLTQRQAAQRMGTPYRTVARVVSAAMRRICADLEAHQGPRGASWPPAETGQQASIRMARAGLKSRRAGA
ncbi:sigma factor-like helix-turn-helix DNA-binding protein [uncultured Jatrophihabitans sp.]|uniref:sigma factor-like helix-turn-helix DNA-binding protein n=1 Tax=uncultured Jatrophihabitans sp. TaxID=1610747 RepID=UPI0035CB2A17